MKRLLKWIGICFGVLIGLSVVAGLGLYSIGMKNLNQTIQNIAVETIEIPSDADAPSRGKHVATIWECTRCHGKDLSGMMISKDPLMGIVPMMGTIPAPNLTGGKGGIATVYTDTDWIRAIRHGVMPGGRVEALMFDYSTMSDQDLGDLIAYLKQVPPIDTNYPQKRYGVIVPIVSNIGLLMPAAIRINHGTSHVADTTPGATAEYGRYLSTICATCHGESIGNVVKNWKQEDFIRIFKTGFLPDGKLFGPTMSSDTFREMTDTELTALWLYFTSGKP